MSQFPSLPLFTDAYIADTAHLTNEEHGAYLRLLMFAWRAPQCRLHDDDVRIARMLGLTAKKWAALKPSVMAFWILENGFWTQKRLAREHQFVTRQTETRRASGSRGGTAKALKDKEAGLASLQSGQQQNDGKQVAPTPTPTPTEDNTPVVPAGRTAEQPALFDDSEKVTPIKRGAPTDAEIEVGFAKLWATYPSRKGSNRKTSLQRYAKAIRAGHSPGAILAGAKAYAAHLTRTGRIGTEFVKTTEVWLNKEAWLDDYEPIAPPERKYHMV